MILPFLLSVLISQGVTAEERDVLASLHPLVQAYCNSVLELLKAWRPIEYIFNVTVPVEDAARTYYDLGYAKASSVGYQDPDQAARIMKDAQLATFGRLTPLKLAQANAAAVGQFLLDPEILYSVNLAELAIAYADSVKRAVETYPFQPHLAAIENGFVYFAIPRGLYNKEVVIRGHETYAKFLHLVVGDIQTI